MRIVADRYPKGRVYSYIWETGILCEMRTVQVALEMRITFLASDLYAHKLDHAHNEQFDELFENVRIMRMAIIELAKLLCVADRYSSMLEDEVKESQI